MDPFPVSQKAYVANDSIAYEAQLVAAIIHTRAPIEGRPTYTYEGEGQNLACTVSVKMRDDPEPKVMVSPKVGDIKIKNSPLWVSNPRQQLAYHTIRNWARLYCPEIILGVYDVDEMEDAARAATARDVTPPSAPVARPTRADFKPQPEQAREADEADVAEEPARTLQAAAEIEAALKAAPDREELRAIWQSVNTEGDLAAVKEADEAAHAALCQLYNSLAEAFEPATNNDAQEEEPAGENSPEPGAEEPKEEQQPRFALTSDKEVFDRETGEVVDPKFVRLFNNGTFSVLKGYYGTVAEENPAEERKGKDDNAGEASEASKPLASFADQAIGHIRSLSSASKITGWFDNVFLDDAAARDLAAEEVDRVRRAMNDRLRELQPKKQ
jgi:hypothetical protein